MKSKIIKKLLLSITFGSLTGTLLFLFAQNDQVIKKINRNDWWENNDVGFNIRKVVDAKQAYTAASIMRELAKELLYIKNKQPTLNLINSRDTPLLNHFEFKIKQTIKSWRINVLYADSSKFTRISFEFYFNGNNNYPSIDNNTLRFTNLKPTIGAIAVPKRKDVVWNLALQGGNENINHIDGFLDPNWYYSHWRYKDFADNIIFPGYQETKRGRNRLWTTVSHFKVNDKKTVVEYNWTADFWEFNWSEEFNSQAPYLKTLNIGSFILSPLEKIARITIVFDPRDMPVPPPPPPPEPPVDDENSSQDPNGPPLPQPEPTPPVNPDPQPEPQPEPDPILPPDPNPNLPPKPDLEPEPQPTPEANQSNNLSVNNKITTGLIATLVSACIMTIMMLFLTSVMLSPFGGKEK